MNNETLQVIGIQNKDMDSQIKDSFSGVMGDFFDEVTNRANYSNVSIYIDYDNVYWTLMNNYQHDPDQDDVNKNLFNKLWDKYGRDSIRSFRAYADFDHIRTQLTSLQKKRIQIKHVYSKGKDDFSRKNSSDIELCIDAIENTYKDEKTNCYIIVTADSDMIPLLSRLMYKGKRVELFYLSDAVSKHIDITRYAHESYDLIDFLNVEKKVYNLEIYVIDALNFIKTWWDKYQDNNNVFLGTNWLVGKYQENFELPEMYASQLFEKLVTEELVNTMYKKEFKGDFKPSVALTEKGSTLLDEFTKEIATN